MLQNKFCAESVGGASASEDCVGRAASAAPAGGFRRAALRGRGAAPLRHAQGRVLAGQAGLLAALLPAAPGAARHRPADLGAHPVRAARLPVRQRRT